MSKLKRIFTAFTVMTVLCLSAFTASAYEYGDIPEGTYTVKAELSCYVNAMGGVEFGAPLLVSSQIRASSDGSKTMTLYFTKSSVTIYSITCDTFIDVSPSYVTETNGIKSGTLGYYGADGALITDDITYTLSEDTAENAQNEQVHYVDSVTFPIRYESDTYKLSLFVNSNVMGTQFTADGYAATLTVDWDSVSADALPDTDVSAAETEPADKETASVSADVKAEDGLNIYPADASSEDESTEKAPTEEIGTYIAHFKEPLLIAVCIAAVVMIVTGIILVSAGRKEKEQ